MSEWLPVLHALLPKQPLELNFDAIYAFILLIAHKPEAFFTKVFPIQSIKKMIQLSMSTEAVQVSVYGIYF